MNTTFTARIRRHTLTITILAAAVAAAITGSFAQGQAAPAEVRQYQGPGVGSVKTPPFEDRAYLQYKAQQKARALYFHTKDSQAAATPSVKQGPGLHSSKAPGIR